MTNLDSIFKSRDITLRNKGPSHQGYGFSRGGGRQKPFLQSNLHPSCARVTLVALSSLHTHYSEVFLFTAQRLDLQRVLQSLVNPPAPFRWLSSTGVLPN